MLISNGAHVAAAVVLERLGTLVLEGDNDDDDVHKVARSAAVLFALNPASVFHSAPFYTESVFALASFAGFYFLERGARAFWNERERLEQKRCRAVFRWRARRGQRRAEQPGFGARLLGGFCRLSRLDQNKNKTSARKKALPGPGEKKRVLRPTSLRGDVRVRRTVRHDARAAVRVAALRVPHVLRARARRRRRPRGAAGGVLFPTCTRTCRATTGTSASSGTTSEADSKLPARRAGARGERQRGPFVVDRV